MVRAVQPRDVERESVRVSVSVRACVRACVSACKCVRYRMLIYVRVPSKQRHIETDRKGEIGRLTSPGQEEFRWWRLLRAGMDRGGGESIDG